MDLLSGKRVTPSSNAPPPARAAVGTRAGSARSGARPRGGLASRKRVVEEMTRRVGYPARLTDKERMDDLASVDRRHADRYRTGLGLKADSTTEEMRRTLRSYLDLARDLLDRGTGASSAAVEAESRPEIAG